MASRVSTAALNPALRRLTLLTNSTARPHLLLPMFSCALRRCPSNLCKPTLADSQRSISVWTLADQHHFDANSDFGRITSPHIVVQHWYSTYGYRWYLSNEFHRMELCRYIGPRLYDNQ
jgi:hypothetical protein